MEKLPWSMWICLLWCRGGKENKTDGTVFGCVIHQFILCLHWLLFHLTCRHLLWHPSPCSILFCFHPFLCLLIYTPLHLPWFSSHLSVSSSPSFTLSHLFYNLFQSNLYAIACKKCGRDGKHRKKDWSFELCTGSASHSERPRVTTGVPPYTYWMSFDLNVGLRI